jgi:prefoldin alpha subunit
MKEKKNEVKVSAKHLLDTYNQDQRKLAELQRREQEIRQILTEMTIAAESLKGIQKASKEQNIMVGLGAGIYAEAKIANVKTVKNSLAGNVLVEGEIEKVLLKLEEDIKNTKNDITAVRNEAHIITKNLQNVASILQDGQRAASQQQTKNQTPSVS